MMYGNQTQEHDNLCKATLRFLASMSTNKGYIWMQEHTLHNGMRPDAVGICAIQKRFLEKMYGDHHHPQEDSLYVFESKVSYSDYKNSFNKSGTWKNQPYANFHFLVVPKGFSQKHDLSHLPEYFGILEPVQYALAVVKYPIYVPVERTFLLEAAYTILFKWERAKQFLDIEIEHHEHLFNLKQPNHE